jgi:S1-C subfamily serine protease
MTNAFFSRKWLALGLLGFVAVVGLQVPTGNMRANAQATKKGQTAPTQKQQTAPGGKKTPADSFMNLTKIGITSVADVSTDKITGCQIFGLDPSGAAAQRGIKVNDVIVRVNGGPATSGSYIDQLIGQAISNGNSSVNFTLQFVDSVGTVQTYSVSVPLNTPNLKGKAKSKI